MVAIGNLPVRFILKKVGLILPFAVLVGLFNPVFDHRVLFHIGTWEITGGWVSLASITVRAILTAGAAVVLVGLTGFPAICAALERLGMPKAFTIQLLFLYRYIFVLTEEGARAARARELRSFGKKGRGLSSYGPLVGHLLLRTWMRAERIHTAMLARGFTGDFHTRENFRFGRVEVLFLVGWTALFILFRLQNVSHLLGSFILGMLS